ncbi:AraC family transcriptional regulator [Bradyrhizobium diazoefficiens]|nr:AraC family transcriptional regulator [Bradyrhizobium diazoefficiens]MCD9298490.1 AraC family transcriptional regulator [Bradyrhizobium diazoefficiens]MCD9812992.1 AraC family transcriptional regulator [Bradyrhizobium diazoefficiens]MCD9831717.1 AraC family transcriptional regulator [Bradyrhizobium diazoefficiens]MCD9849801.1 AraC family transcriptional regulator [Bradyrhizobium diazoefficiens]MDC8022399.1 AraC family transcriptional regulator [Bradyrhizobium diazoefficiens]
MSLLRADFRHHDYGSHTHDAYVIAVTESGGAEIRNRNVVRTVGAATLFVSNPDERQSARMGDSGRWRYRAFYLAQPAIGDLARRFGTDPLPHLRESMLDDGDLIGRFDRLHRVLETEQDDLLADELVADAFGRLFERYGDGRRSKIPAGRDAVVSRLIALMRERHAENLSLDQLAGLAGLTSFQLIGLFKRTVGLTPHAYLVQIRLNAACHFLRRGHSLADSALAAGFCDQAALNKHFRRCYGITPLQFAQAARAG